jgi:ribosomal protein S18 acetylase RimI-like enzyme
MTSVGQPGIRLRGATERDVTSLAAMYGELHREQWPIEPAVGRSTDWSAEVLATLSQPRNVVLVAESQDTLAGTIRVEIIDRPYGAIAEIRRLFVDPRWRRRGIGSRLLASAEEVAVTNGVCDVRLTVLAGNRAAARFYESRGYTDFARRYRRAIGT